MLQTLHVFPKLDQLLLDLLSSLEDEDWQRSTIARAWKVKDIAYHLLDTTIKGISLSREKHFPDELPQSGQYQDIVAFINEQNGLWVRAAQRISFPLLIDLLRITTQQYYEHLSSLDLEEKALFSVGWAGEEKSKNWFHIAREYTEKWHHQAQIRLAVGQEEVLLTEELYRPFLDTCFIGLPYHFRNISGEPFSIHVEERPGMHWSFGQTDNGWQPIPSQSKENTIHVPANILWRILMKGIDPNVARKQLLVNGNLQYADALLNMRTVMV